MRARAELRRCRVMKRSCGGVFLVLHRTTTLPLPAVGPMLANELVRPMWRQDKPAAGLSSPADGWDCAATAHARTRVRDRVRVQANLACLAVFTNFADSATARSRTERAGVGGAGGPEGRRGVGRLGLDFRPSDWHSPSPQLPHTKELETLNGCKRGMRNTQPTHSSWYHGA